MSHLDQAIDRSLASLEESESLDGLSEEVRVLVLVHAAQGTIDNGGLRYFFELDFSDQPPYGAFVEAYRAIGQAGAADTLARSVALFPFDDPHRHARERNGFLEALAEGELREFEELTDALCGNEAVWVALEAYVEAHASAFGLA